MSMYSLRIREDGMREPHWHPATAEMGYVASGSSRMTVMDPDGSLDTWYLEQGDMYFIPRAYPHHIEVVDAPDLHFAIFFDQSTPADIGYRASASAYSHEVLAATFGVHIADLPNFPFTNADPLIVNRVNPLDPPIVIAPTGSGNPRIMEKISLTALAREHLELARSHNSGRSAHTVYGGHEHSLRQTLIALAGGNKLDEHEAPEEATLYVVTGRVRLGDGTSHWEGSSGDLIVIPKTRHDLAALEDSAVLLTVLNQVGPHA